MAAYYKRLTSDDDEVSLKAATAWSLWEESTCHLYQNAETIAKVEDARWARYVLILHIRTVADQVVHSLGSNATTS